MMFFASTRPMKKRTSRKPVMIDPKIPALAAEAFSFARGKIGSSKYLNGPSRFISSAFDISSPLMYSP